MVVYQMYSILLIPYITIQTGDILLTNGFSISNIYSSTVHIRYKQELVRGINLEEFFS